MHSIGLHFFIGCTQNLDSSLKKEVEKQLISGDILRRMFSNFQTIEKLDKISEGEYIANVRFDNRMRKLNISISVETFKAYPDDKFAKYIHKWYSGSYSLADALKEAIKNGDIKALGEIKIKLVSKTITVTDSLASTLDKNNEWTFAQRFDAANPALEAFKTAYPKEEDEEFLKFIR